MTKISKNQKQQNENTWSVYVHINKCNGKRYVGITSLDVENRWRNGDGYKNQMFGRAIAKYGWDSFDHIVLFDNLPEYQVNTIECELIAFWKTRHSKYGYNVLGGGSGTSGYKFSEESRAKMSESAKKRNICYSTRKKHPPISDETRLKMSNNNAGENNPNYNRMHTPDELRKMGLSHSKQVAMLDNVGNVLKIFESAKKASEYIGVDKSAVSKVCRGVLMSCRGYYLKYV